MMDKVFINSSDTNVAVRKIYIKNADTFAYADNEFKTKMSSNVLYDAFIKGMVIVDASRVEYLPVSCKVTGGVTTVTYVTTDSSSATTAKLAIVKSE